MDLSPYFLLFLLIFSLKWLILEKYPPSCACHATKNMWGIRSSYPLRLFRYRGGICSITKRCWDFSAVCLFIVISFSVSAAGRTNHSATVEWSILPLNDQFFCSVQLRKSFENALWEFFMLLWCGCRSGVPLSRNRFTPGGECFAACLFIVVCFSGSEAPGIGLQLPRILFSACFYTTSPLRALPMCFSNVWIRSLPGKRPLFLRGGLANTSHWIASPHASSWWFLPGGFLPMVPPIAPAWIQLSENKIGDQFGAWSPVKALEDLNVWKWFALCAVTRGLYYVLSQEGCTIFFFSSSAFLLLFCKKMCRFCEFFGRFRCKCAAL